MSGGHGKDAVVKFANESDVVTDYTTYTTRANWKPTTKNSESTAMGSTAKKRIPGIKDASWTWDGWFDGVSGAVIRALYKARGKSKAFQLGPEGTASGKQRITGTAILTSLVIKPAVDGTVPFTATFAINGAFVKDTWP